MVSTGLAAGVGIAGAIAVIAIALLRGDMTASFGLLATAGATGGILGLQPTPASHLDGRLRSAAARPGLTVCR
jgi:hypothetical protein